jgi:hypothetical protein
MRSRPSTATALPIRREPRRFVEWASMPVAAPSPFTEVACDLLARGHAIRFRPPGCSMAPAIWDGEAVTVEPALPPDVRIGDIILYRANRGVIAHRVVRIVPQASACDEAAPVFILRGAAAGSPEERVESRSILGRVTAVERKSLGARMLRTARLGAGRIKGLVRNGWRSRMPAGALTAQEEDLS